MSYYQNGGRPRFNRSARPQNFRNNNRSKIDPNRYVNAAFEPQDLPVQEVTHAFVDFGLHPQLEQNVIKRGYSTPTPIQDQAIPVMMENKDVVGIANTGTGKTAAFLLPLIHKTLLDPTQATLIMAPTRELALQIFDEFKAFAAQLPIGVAVCIGGTGLDSQIHKLKNRPHFVIGTPGRLKDLVNRYALKMNLINNIVLDEVDRMLDIGFRRDIMFLISKLPTERQAAFFSATLNRETTEVMQALLRQPVTISVKTTETSDHIHQDIIKIKPGESKVDVLHQLLQQNEFEKVIVFGRTKHGINKLEEQLYKRGVQVRSIHGNKSQGARQRSLQDFKRGYVQALLATDIAARGIDIENVTHVINYDEPQSYEDYVHRIGRTGRAGKIGKALTFVG